MEDGHTVLGPKVLNYLLSIISINKYVMNYYGLLVADVYIESRHKISQGEKLYTFHQIWFYLRPDQSWKKCTNFLLQTFKNEEFSPIEPNCNKSGQTSKSTMTRDNDSPFNS